PRFARSRPRHLALAARGIPPAPDAPLPGRRGFRIDSTPDGDFSRFPARASQPRAGDAADGAQARPGTGIRRRPPMTANETTDHAWVRENVATYLAGGLPEDERARFEAHVGGCGSCLEDLQDAQGAERSLAAVFQGDRPDPGL